MPKPYYEDKWVKIFFSDCREILLSLDKGSAIVTDPPYELGFMGKSWDGTGVSFQKETWQIIRDSCFPGAMLLSFGGTRTFHRIACTIEDAGWEYRDTIMWVYGSGFPKSLDISKAIDYDTCREQLTEKLGRKPTKDELKAEWEQFRNIVGTYKTPNGRDYTLEQSCQNGYNKTDLSMGHEKGIERRLLTQPQSSQAQLWEGYGTALKPAYEPIIVAMNPLDGTFVQNALKHGVAGLNIDRCRIVHNDNDLQCQTGHKGQPFGSREHNFTPREYTNKGRFPANFIHDGSQIVMELFPNSKSTGGTKGISTHSPVNTGGGNDYYNFGDSGSAARFFYCAKASKSERNKGCEELELKRAGSLEFRNRESEKGQFEGSPQYSKNNHPTVKPLALMEYLVKLVKMPEYNLIIDPFMGSGTTLLACIRLGIPCIGIDNDEKSCEIAAKRCSQEVMVIQDQKKQVESSVQQAKML